MHDNVELESTNFISDKRPLKVVLTSGASCPDATIDRVIQRILEFTNTTTDIESVLTKIKQTFNEEV